MWEIDTNMTQINFEQFLDVHTTRATSAQTRAQVDSVQLFKRQKMLCMLKQTFCKIPVPKVKIRKVGRLYTTVHLKKKTCRMLCCVNSLKCTTYMIIEEQ